MLKVKKLDPRAKLPTVAHPGEDLAYDLYALEDTRLNGIPTLVRTGIAAQAFARDRHRLHIFAPWTAVGLLIRDRSSMATQGITTSGGVIDPGYTGEIQVIMTSNHRPYEVHAGDKIAQMIPIPVLTGDVVEVTELDASSRGSSGFGSSGSR